MPKNKGHKGTLKRIRITKTGKVRMKRAGSGHFKSSKSPDRLRRLRGTTSASDSETKRLERLLHRRLRGATQPRATLRRSPSPEQRAAMKEAKKAEQAS